MSFATAECEKVPLLKQTSFLFFHISHAKAAFTTSFAIAEFFESDSREDPPPPTVTFRPCEIRPPSFQNSDHLFRCLAITKMWSVDSGPPRRKGHRFNSKITPRFSRLSFVDKRFNRKRHMKILTLDGIALFQVVTGPQLLRRTSS